MAGALEAREPQAAAKSAATPAPAPAQSRPTPPPPPAPGGLADQLSVAVPKAPEGPTIKQGPIGDLVFRLPDWNFLPVKGFTKPILDKAVKAPLLPGIPIPELGVRVDVVGSAEASASLSGSYEGWLRNLQVGISRAQAVRMSDTYPLLWLFGMPDTLDGFAALSTEFRALADLDISGRFGGRLHLGAELRAAASAVGLFEVAHLGAGLDANAAVEAELRFRDQLGVYGSGHGFHFRDNPSLDLTITLHFDLAAYLQAGLLGARWRKEWNLIQFDRSWMIGTSARVDYNSTGAKVTEVDLTEQVLAVIDIVQSLLHAANTQAQLTSEPAAQGGSGAPPTGRTAADPIPMVWYKSPGVYPPSITLSGQQYFLTEPDRVPVPRNKGLRDVEREAETDRDGNYVIRIGVSPGSRFYPLVGGPPWPRVAAGAIRTGRKQAQFRRLLSAHGYDWGSFEADHVRDLQWAGDDAYNNLWPLERSRNNAANRVLDQLVTYTDAARVPRTVPLRQTPLNLYFQIRSFA